MFFAIKPETGARAYVVSDGKRYAQVTLPVRIVNGLKNLNTGSLRAKPNYDNKFVKVLLIACIGKAKINENKMDPLIVDFIRGNFII